MSAREGDAEAALQRLEGLGLGPLLTRLERLLLAQESSDRLAYQREYMRRWRAKRKGGIPVRPAGDL